MDYHAETMVVKYEIPGDWIGFDGQAILGALAGAKAAVLALTQLPYQRSWAENFQRIQLKREVAGTSKIEGAEFTEKELDAAMKESPERAGHSEENSAARPGLRAEATDSREKDDARD